MANQDIFSPKRAELLEEIYNYYNDFSFVHPDPLEFLKCNNKEDIEIAGLIASSLAYGRVNIILSSVSRVIKPMGSSLKDYLLTSSKEEIAKPLKGFKHRFTTEDEMINFLFSIKSILREYSSLKNSFSSFVRISDLDYAHAVSAFSALIYKYGGFQKCSLVPKPNLNSACKRIYLFLRWMIRKDRVDMGCWDGLNPSKLLVPLDTHMHSVALKLGLTCAKSNSLKTAKEITAGFRLFCPTDPVKYDFALTRPGIRRAGEDENNLERFFKLWHV